MKAIEIKAEEYGIDQANESNLMGNLPIIKQERQILESQYSEVILLDLDAVDTSKIARELRLKIQKNRTQGINKWHKEAKEMFLKGGQFVDAIKKVEVSVNEHMESKLEEIERYAENKEIERVNKLRFERIELLQMYSEFVPFGIDLGVLGEEEFTKVYNGAKLQFDANLDEQKKLEEERLENQRVLDLHNKRKNELLNIWQYVENTNVNFGEINKDDYLKIVSDANSKKVAFENEQIRVRLENERLAKEKQEIENKAILEKQKADQELAEQKAKQEKELKKQREIQLKLEEEINRQKQAEQAEKQRLLDIQEATRLENERLTKEPIKNQMLAWINAFELPITELENDKVKDIISKFNSFKSWAKNETYKL